MSRNPLPHRPALLALSTLALLGASGCQGLLAFLPALSFCGTAAPSAEILRLAEGPAMFVDVMGALAKDLGGQGQAVGRSLQSGLSFQGLKGSDVVLKALGAYNYEGTGGYKRGGEDGRSYRLGFFYGSGVAGKTEGAPLEADLARIDSYLKAPDLGSLIGSLGAGTSSGISGGFAGEASNGFAGPLFPLVQALGVSEGKLSFRDDIVAFDAGGAMVSQREGYDLKLSVGTVKQGFGAFIKGLGEGKIKLSLADTSMSRPDRGFKLSVARFDATLGLNGNAPELGGTYSLAIEQSSLKYHGVVTTPASGPVLALSCQADGTKPFASVSFVGGKPEVKLESGNLPLGFPALKPLVATP